MQRLQKTSPILESKPALVSVIVPAYNGERTILSTLESIARQKYRPLQVIVIDDASKDSTLSLIEHFKKEKIDMDFSLFRHEVNMGLSWSLNDGLSQAIGDFVLILHQDCELASNRWIERAIALIENKKVAIVTGYYGISDEQEETFVKRAFGVIRKQFHSRPKATYEEVTFSEGKCDLYKKSLLLQTNGFPMKYRIAGEDLVVSYRLRKLGYKIVKCYDLPVIQRFGGDAQSLLGNLGKEFLFGKAIGGVFSEFKLFLFKDIPNSKYSKSRSLHRFSQPIFFLAFLGLMFSAIIEWRFAYFLAGLLLIRCGYYFFKIFTELKLHRNTTSHPFLESIAAALIGILSDFMYSLGFIFGLVKYGLGVGRD